MPGDRLWDKDLRKLLGEDTVFTHADGETATIGELADIVDGEPKPDPPEDRSVRRERSWVERISSRFARRGS